MGLPDGTRRDIDPVATLADQCICLHVHYLWIPINSDPISPRAFFGHGGSPMFAGRASAAGSNPLRRAGKRGGDDRPLL
jgi:hypothetical protein